MGDEKDSFRVKLTGTGLSVDQEVSRDVALRIVNLVVGGVAVGGAPPGAGASPEGGGVAAAPPAGGGTAKQFVTGKKPKTDVEKITCLAYYLRHYRNVSAFKTGDLIALNTEAQQLDFSNASVASNNALRSGLLGKAGKGSKQITAKGEAVVDALPDQEKVKEAMKHGGKRKRRRNKKPAS